MEEEDLDESPRDGDGGILPLLIDATLPVLHASSPAAVNARGRAWRALMLETGITAVKAAGSCPYSTDAARGLDWAFRCDWRRLFGDLRALGLPEIAFGNAAGEATALASAWLVAGGGGTVCSLGGEGGLPDLVELRLLLHVRGIMPMRAPDTDVRRIRELGGSMKGGIRGPFVVRAA
ncbi:MAG: hypothetical protein LBT40_15560 [Deltaproteobacteria bacterium]|nr:hypothetical protein [Deltaproteobacteria bacterium]